MSLLDRVGAARFERDIRAALAQAPIATTMPVLALAGWHTLIGGFGLVLLSLALEPVEASHLRALATWPTLPPCRWCWWSPRRSTLPACWPTCPMRRAIWCFAPRGSRREPGG